MRISSSKKEANSERAWTRAQKKHSVYHDSRFGIKQEECTSQKGHPWVQICRIIYDLMRAEEKHLHSTLLFYYLYLDTCGVLEA